ncbi:hypothetical protein [Leptospira sp. GIMC2001]|uniref:hypothetical protein n=1 Tax=Leptospira sp. GIMC2001 TaxID=1513297 RepID=UPI002349A3DD|nr:hypothetical protein [Leptospira sp. GIMC2001]WCL49459.1 hypothetical protein O4O04_19550 [Leptospira sp. GIMC2001]
MNPGIEPIINVDSELLYSLADRFKELRIHYGYSLTELSDRLKKNYNLSINDNLLGKIERKESRLQSDQMISLLLFYKIELREILDIPSLTAADGTTRLIKEYSRNPEFQSVVNLILDNISDFSFLSYVRSFLKLTVQHIISRTDPSSLKAASPNKKKQS